MEEIELKNWKLEEDIKFPTEFIGKVIMKKENIDEPIQTVEIYNRKTVNSILKLTKLYSDWYETVNKKSLVPKKLKIINKNTIILTLI